MQQVGLSNIRGVGLPDMTLIEKLFAYENLALDRVEKDKEVQNIILSIGMLIKPENASEVIKRIEIEEQLTEEQKEAIRKHATRKMRDLTSDGKVKSDPIPQAIIRRRRAGSMPIKGLREIAEEEEDANSGRRGSNTETSDQV